jgi:adenosine deaminase
MVPGWVAELPKVELHVHVEGSIRPETVLRLARKNGVELPTTTIEGLREFYRFRDFPHFVEVYVAVTRCIQDADDLRTVFLEFADGQAEQNIVYTEATYTASTVESHCGIPWPDQLDAFRDAMQEARNRHGCDVRLVLDIVRGQSTAEAFRTLEWVSGALEAGVCALGLAGEERRGTAAYAEVFREAVRRNVPVTAHAGETCGPESVAETVDVCRPARIGHGVRAIEDPEVLARLVDRGTVLEVCPTSNVCLGVAPSLAAHPLPRLVERGVQTVVGSDDPPMFGTTLSGELVACADELGLGRAWVAEAQVRAAHASFLPAPERARLAQRVGGPQPV